MKTREDRRRVRLDARMRTDTGWSTVSILNVSAHGMLLHADCVPKRGAYLDIRRDAQWYTVRTMWVNGQAFGVRAQDLIDIDRLIAPRPPGAGRPGSGDSTPPNRRRDARPADPAWYQAIGRMIQYGAAVGAIVLMAGLIAEHVGGVLGAPVQAIERALLPR